jgi:hypothetical protein
MLKSDSTQRPSSSRRRAPRNPYSQAEANESLALFLASRNLPVPDSLKRPVDRPSRSNKRQKHGEHKSNPEVPYVRISCRIVVLNTIIKH